MPAAPLTLKKIRLEDIGCFARKTIRFSGMTVIFGENRTGKSTLVYAVYFALYGKHLNSHLKVTDLCRKGAATGKVTLYFTKNGTSYKLGRKTDALPKLFSRTAPEAPWEPISVYDPEVLADVVSIRPETAALGSFFRESELIYFLQEMPKYNKTLLQSLIGMDDSLILRGRFKKALSRAREVKNAIENAAPKKSVDPLNLELTRRQIADAEKALADIAPNRPRTDGTDLPDPTIYKLLKQQHQAKTQNLAALRSLAANFPEKAALAAEKENLTSQRESHATAPGNTPADEARLECRLGGLIQKADNLRLRMRHIDGLAERPTCPVCEQAVPPDQIDTLRLNIAAQLARTETAAQRIEEGLQNIRNMKEIQAARQKRLTEIERQTSEIRDIEHRIEEVGRQLAGLTADLAQFDRLLGEIHETPAGFGRRPSAEERRAHLHEEIIRHRVALKRYEDDLKHADAHRKHIASARRHVLVCKVAFQAVEEAIQGLGSRLLEKVRNSVGDWSRHFSFLDRFDIQVTDRELLPMIQAKGYQYKLNQMSKSERIFLYLLLKLAIGDALGHLGVFVLDDPADGLDLKRKRTLAYLLSEVGARRQILVTTNDADFSDLFADGRRVDL